MRDRGALRYDTVVSTVMANLGFKLAAAAKAAASFRNLPVEVTSIQQVKELVKAKELPGVGKASVERLQAWFETG